MTTFQQVAHQVVESVLGSAVGLILPNRAYWAVKLRDKPLSRRWQCELDTIFDSARGEHRPFDWTLDLVATGDIRLVEELWLFVPPNPGNPAGQSARLEITQAYTAFQVKVKTLDAFAGSDIQLEAQLIGRVDNPDNGECSCFVWDPVLQKMGMWQSCIYEMGSWREGIIPLGSVSQDILGLRV